MFLHCYTLKEEYHEIFHIFLKTTSPGPIRHAQKGLLIMWNIRGDKKKSNCLPVIITYRSDSAFN
jgi:hypothetical protein